MQITGTQKEFEIKNLSEYHDLHVQSNTLLVADVFNKFRNIYREIFELDRGHFLFGKCTAGFTRISMASNL